MVTNNFSLFRQTEKILSTYLLRKLAGSCFGFTVSRMRLHELTIAAALAHKCGCVGSRIRVRESVIRVSFFNKSS